MTDSKNKERTSITIDPELLVRARAHCVQESLRAGRKVSFSELVSRALEGHMAPSEDEDPWNSTSGIREVDYVQV